MDEANSGLVDKVHVVPRFRPRAAVIDAGAGGGGEHAHPIDWQIGLAFVMHQGENFLVVRNDRRGANAADIASREGLLRHDDVEEVFTASRRRIKHFAIWREIKTPGVARAGCDLFQCRAIRSETKDACGDMAEGFAAVARLWIAGAV